MPLSKIILGDNFRGRKETDVTELTASIKEQGLLQPIIVTPSKKIRGKYDLAAGYRRHKAMKLLRMKTLPVVVSEKGDRITINIIENLQREETNPYDVGRGIDRIMRNNKCSVSEAAASLGLAKSKAESFLNVFSDTPKKYRDRITNKQMGTNRGGKIPMIMARSITNAKKAGKINASNTEKLFAYVIKSETINNARLKIIINNLEHKKTWNDSINLAEEFCTYTLKVPIKTKRLNQLKNKHKKTLHGEMVTALKREFRF